MKSQFRHDLTHELRAAHLRQKRLDWLRSFALGCAAALLSFAAGQVAAYLTTH